MPYGWTDHMGWGGAFMMLVGTVFWALLIAALVLFVMRLLAPGTFRGALPGEDEAIAILRARYARGEIDKQEYEERLRDLRQ